MLTKKCIWICRFIPVVVRIYLSVKYGCKILAYARCNENFGKSFLGSSTTFLQHYTYSRLKKRRILYWTWLKRIINVVKNFIWLKHDLWLTFLSFLSFSANFWTVNNWLHLYLRESLICHLLKILQQMWTNFKHKIILNKKSICLIRGIERLNYFFEDCNSKWVCGH